MKRLNLDVSNELFQMTPFKNIVKIFNINDLLVVLVDGIAPEKIITFKKRKPLIVNLHK